MRKKIKTEGFLGFERVKPSKANVLITEYPFDENSSIAKGAAEFCTVLHDITSHMSPITMNGMSLAGVNLFINDQVKSIADTAWYAKEAFKYDAFPIFLGGDSSVSIGSEKEFYKLTNNNRRKAAIVYIGAHAKLLQSFAKNRYSHLTTNYHALENGYEKEDLCLIGVRSYTLEETNFLHQNPSIRVFGMKDIWYNGISSIVNEIKTKYDSSIYDIYLSINMDCLDPSFASATGSPVGLGMSVKELYQLVTGLFLNANIKACDIVEVCPPLDTNNATSYNAAKILYEILRLVNNA